MNPGYIQRIPALLVLGVLRAYQRTRILRAPSCRFYPSCSEYMARCVERHGFLKGTVAGMGRLCRCHPWHPGGVDDVPAEIRLVPRFARRRTQQCTKTSSRII